MTTIYTTKTAAEIRNAVKTIFGAKNAKVTRNGEVHVKGMMPNTNQNCWYLLGFSGQQELDDRIWNLDGSLNTSLAK